jgi:hypothetical protein
MTVNRRAMLGGVMESVEDMIKRLTVRERGYPGRTWRAIRGGG